MSATSSKCAAAYWQVLCVYHKRKTSVRFKEKEKKTETERPTRTFLLANEIIGLRARGSERKKSLAFDTYCFQHHAHVRRIAQHTTKSIVVRSKYENLFSFHFVVQCNVCIGLCNKKLSLYNKWLHVCVHIFILFTHTNKQIIIERAKKKEEGRKEANEIAFHLNIGKIFIYIRFGLATLSRVDSSSWFSRLRFPSYIRQIIRKKIHAWAQQAQHRAHTHTTA